MPEHDSVDPETERRLRAAFTALATTEVPTTAPRPGAAPRPVATGPGLTRRRRFGIAGAGLLVAAAAVTVAVLVGGEVQQAEPGPTLPAGSTGASTTAPATPAAPTSGSVTFSPSMPPSSPNPDPSTGASTPVGSGAEGSPTLAEATSAFAAVSDGTRSDVVQVPGGFEGADLDAGTIRFWRSTGGGTTWTVEGTSTYPADIRGDGATTYSGFIRSAALLTGMDHASFLVYGGAFTGDTTGFVIVYTDGPDGWGVIKAEGDGNLHPSGAPVDPANQIGLMYDGALAGGLLQTVDCSPSVAAAECGSPTSLIRKNWRWDGTQFVVDP